MKKIFLAMMAVVILFVSSCQKENFGEESIVSFNIGTPEIATRAYSDGTKATVLQYAVYDGQGNYLDKLTVNDAKIQQGGATVSLQLAIGNTYSVIFWAAAEDAPYAIDFAQKTMTVDYENALCNDERRDAFYAYHTFTVTGNQTENIKLVRPFAQLNIGTNDYVVSSDAGYTPTQSKVVVKNIYTKLNLANTDTTQLDVTDPIQVTFDWADIERNEIFPVEKDGVVYEYLAMNYLLVAANKEVVDVEFTYTNGSTERTKAIGSVPVQRNRRTNIYGALLTSGVDFDIEIEPEYNDTTNYYLVATWDEFTAALDNGEKNIMLTADISYSDNYSLRKDITLNLGGNSITMPLFYVFSTATIENGTINGKMYARTGCNLTLDGLTFSGTISDDLSTEGHLQVQGGCDVYAKDCVFAATQVNGSQTRSLSIEASSSGTRKFENCDFKFVALGSNPGKYKKNVYVNTMSGTTTVDFTNCKLNVKAPNVLFASTYSLTNFTMSDCDNTAPTLETNRAKDAITEAEWAHISSLIANNKFSQVRLFYAGGSSEYIKK